MGNCCLKGSRLSTMVWVETDDETDQWEYYSDPNLQQNQSLLCDERIGYGSNPFISVNENSNNNGKNREVKIILSKKKLEELLSEVEDVRNVPVNQILDRLIDSSDRFELDDDHHHHNNHQRPWKPNLKSIPEEN